MFDFIKTNKMGATETVDIIEKSVYELLKPLGFRKFGRTLHRFVSNDISQVVNFQVGLAIYGLNDRMYVNVGIRIPECSERGLENTELKRYYHEYNCTIRSRLVGYGSKQDYYAFLLKKSPSATANRIIKYSEI